ncbi:transcriptional repressor LexA [Streptomyces sp. NPDC054855]
MRSVPHTSVPSASSPRSAGRLPVRQERVLQAIRESIRTRGYPPSMQEIGAAVGLTSTSSVAYHLDVLCKQGWLRTVPNKARAYVPADLVHEPDVPVPAAALARVPLVVVSSDGAPASGHQVLEVLVLPRLLVGDGELFAVAVADSSMEAASVLDGDLVVVRRQGPMESNDLVAVVLDGKATVRRFKRDGANAQLLTGNGSSPIWCDESALLGRVVTVLRCL